MGELIEIKACFFRGKSETGTITRVVPKLRALSEYRRVPHLSWIDRDPHKMGYMPYHDARDVVDTAARTMHFMDTAALSPSSAWSALFGDTHDLPGFLHTQVWICCNAHLVTTEPCNRDAMFSALDWCFDNRWGAYQIRYWGLHNPKMPTMILCAPPKSLGVLDAVLQRLMRARPIPLEARERDARIVLENRSQPRPGLGQ